VFLTQEPMKNPGDCPPNSWTALHDLYWFLMIYCQSSYIFVSTSSGRTSKTNLPAVAWWFQRYTFSRIHGMTIKPHQTVFFFLIHWLLVPLASYFLIMMTSDTSIQGFGGTLFNPLSGQISSWPHVVTETWNGNWIWITISKMAQLLSLVKYDDLLRYMGNSMGQWDDGYPLVIFYIVNPIWGFPKS
jgi:hypothetical protein